MAAKQIGAQAQNRKSSRKTSSSSNPVQLLLLLGFGSFILARHSLLGLVPAILESASGKSIEWLAAQNNATTAIPTTKNEDASRIASLTTYKPSISSIVSTTRSVDDDPYVFSDTGKKHNGAPKTTPPPDRMMFVHIGKSGGQTVKNVLHAGCDAFGQNKTRERCFAALPSSEISKRVVGYFHVDKMTMRPRKADGFLVVARHPVERAISWYYFVNPNLCESQRTTSTNCDAKKHIMNNPTSAAAEFFACFPRNAQLIDALQGKVFRHHATTTSNNNTDNCLELANQVLQGHFDFKTDPVFGHMIYNIQRYAALVRLRKSSSSPVYVVRTEELWPDMKEIDHMFGGNATFDGIDGLQVTHGTPKAKRKFPVEVRRKMCCILRDEMKWYRDLLAWAQNLPSSEARATWQDAVNYCGESTWGDVEAKCEQYAASHFQGSLTGDSSEGLAISGNHGEEASYRDRDNIFLVDFTDMSDQSVKFSFKAGCQSLARKVTRETCLGNLPKSEISSRVRGYLHANHAKRRNPKDADGFLVVLKHPLERVMSWYNIATPTGCKRPRLTPSSCKTRQFITDSPNSTTAEFFYCFPRIASLPKTIQRDDTTTCQDLAYKVLQGNISDVSADPVFAQMVYNLQWYGKPMDEESPLWVVRPDKPWQDIRQIDTIFGGDGTIGNDEIKANEAGPISSLETTTSRKLLWSTVGVVRRKMCCLLLDELDWYHTFLERATNLQPFEVEASWQDAVARCGAPSWEMLQDRCTRHD